MYTTTQLNKSQRIVLICINMHVCNRFVFELQTDPTNGNRSGRTAHAQHTRATLE